MYCFSCTPWPRSPRSDHGLTSRGLTEDPALRYHGPTPAIRHSSCCLNRPRGAQSWTENIFICTINAELRDGSVLVWNVNVCRQIDLQHAVEAVAYRLLVSQSTGNLCPLPHAGLHSPTQWAAVKMHLFCRLTPCWHGQSIGRASSISSASVAAVHGCRWYGVPGPTCLTGPPVAPSKNIQLKI